LQYKLLKVSGMMVLVEYFGVWLSTAPALVRWTKQ